MNATPARPQSDVRGLLAAPAKYHAITANGTNEAQMK